MVGAMLGTLAVLQWSRNFRAAERQYKLRALISDASLQWSRNFRAAESGRPPRKGAPREGPSMEPQL